ncbi:D-alanine--D-alanine ligase [bioreactor metagenome]|uniref:D-alanine--D-alanine ligase n=1 Tax=bioreactor metagenome TaxID=1076179 RepID=A0A645E745_9ZZZZ
MVDRDTDEVYVNEINTIPGSLAFYLWQASGVDFTQLMDQLVKQAVDRQRQREKMIYSYDTNILAGYRAGFKGKAKG